MELPLACSTVPYEGVALDRALEGIARAGFRQVVVGPAHEGRPTLDLASGAEGAGALAESLGKAGVSALALWPELSPVDDDHAEALGVVVDQAGSLGAGQLWVSAPAAFDETGGGLRSDEDWQADLDAVAANVAGLAARAARLGVTLVFPTEPRATGCAAEAEEFVKLLERPPGVAAALMHSALTAASVDATGAPIPAEQGGQRGMPCVAAGIGLAYNPGLVSYYTGVNPVRDIQYVAPRLKCLCVRDHSGAVGEAVFPRLGGGDVDYMAILAALTGLGFSGPVVVEHLGIEPAPDRSPDELDGAAKAAFRFLDMVLRRL